MRLKKEYAQGINYCNKAIELNRNNPQSYITRGLILQSLKEYKQALSDFKAAQKLAEEDPTFDISEYNENIKAVSRRVRPRKESSDELNPYSNSPGSLGSPGIDEYDNDDDHDEQITIRGSRTSIDDEDGMAPKILKYNDDLEELNRFGVLKYAVYPFKKNNEIFQQ